jgi:hypothetical protein
MFANATQTNTNDRNPSFDHDRRSDERISKEAVNATKFKTKKLVSKKRKLDDSGVKSFVAVQLDKDSPRGVKRIYAQ